MARSRYKITQETQPHFLTFTINQWLPVFTRPDTVNILFNTWKYLQTHRGFKLYGYVILENHLHLIAQSDNLSRDVKAFKAHTARAILDYLQTQNNQFLLRKLAFSKKSYKTHSKHQLWQEDSHPQLIVDENMQRQKLDYIHNNPVKRGYVDKPEHWRYSSARAYFGGESFIEVVTAW